MNRLFVPLLIFLSAVIAGHFAAINLIPGLITVSYTHLTLPTTPYV